MRPTGIRMVDTPVLSAGGVMYYAGGSVGSELWRSDGTVEGTRKVALGGSSSTAPSNLTSAGRFVYFLYANALWRTDGTEAGTISLIFVNSYSFWMTALGEHLYFPYLRYPYLHGEELYRTDGTVEGIELVADIAPEKWSSWPYAGVAVNGALWFSASDALHGSEVWTTEGTAETTRRVSDIFPGPDHGAPEQFASAGNRLFFAASSPSLGKELWALDLEGSAFSVADVRTAEGGAGTRTVRFTITRDGDRSQPASVVVSTESGAATAQVDFDTKSSTLDFAAGESSKGFDVLVRGDVQSEGNEAFWVVLTSAVNARIASGRAAGIIEDDDGPVDLSVEILPSGSATLRKFRVRNSGSSPASDVQLRVTESPALVSSRILAVPSLVPGGSQVVSYSRPNPASILQDSTNTAGITLTATVTSSNVDSNPGNDTASGMTDPSGILLFPAFLHISTSGSGKVFAATPLSVTTDSLLSLNPATQILGPAPDWIATVALQAGSTPGRSRVQAAGSASFSYPIVASGGTATLGTALEVIGARGALGAPLTFKVNVLGTRADGTRPTGTITLRDSNGALLAQATLDANASATFTRSGLSLGTWPHQVHYSGDARFDPLTTDVVLTVAARSSRRRATR
jgi:ELWxxDGT repeat protein